MEYDTSAPRTMYDPSDPMAMANAAQRNWFAQNPALPNYGEVAAGQAYAKPTASTISTTSSPVTQAAPQVLGAPKPVIDPMLAANMAQRARYAANPVVPNATPQTSFVGHIGNMLNKIFGSF